MLVTDSVIVASGEVTLDDFSGGLRMQGKEIYDLDGARGHFARRLIIRLNQQQMHNGMVQNLAHILKPYQQGECPIFMRYTNGKAYAGLRLGENWRIKPTEDLIAQLKSVLGEDNITLEY